MIVGIQDEILKLHSIGLLNRLLADKTTGANILWATDAYREQGAEYQRDKEITAQLITGSHSNIIKNRARKAMEQQSERTRQRGEVFTPLWVCRKMNDFADETWFGRPDVFAKGGQPTQQVSFSKHRSWQRYVDDRRLEITCGEAPYLVSRYDVATGEIIPIANRIGILDRKLRVVNENTADEVEWLTWATRAFQAVYGYEFQGDSLLIARVNLLITFEEYLRNQWKRKPTAKEYQTIANIIAWNIWQMDGLTGAIPYCKAQEEYRQMSLFDWFESEDYQEAAAQQAPCRIFDWRGKRSLAYREVNTGGRNMKFDFVIGNPPYQEETTQEVSQTNGQTPKKNIFHLFQMGVDKVADKATVLIYPAGRWIHRSGKGMEEFGLNQINDITLSKVIFYPDSKEVFGGVAIADGVGIVVKDRVKKSHGFQYVYVKDGKDISVHMNNPGTELIPLNPRDMVITQKIASYVEENGLCYLHERILSRSLFGIESSFIQDNPGKAIPIEQAHKLDYTTQIKLFTNDKAGKAGRAKWFVVDRTTIKNNLSFIDEWQVVVSSANAGGQKRDNQIEIIDNHSAFGRSRVALASFKSEQEAQNFFKYMQTYIVRFMFLMTDEALTSLGKRVPDLKDYSSNAVVDFNKYLDVQLYKLFGLTDSEIKYVENVIKNQRAKNKDKEMV